LRPESRGFAPILRPSLRGWESCVNWIRRDASAVRRGRKPTCESRAAEIRARLAAWRQTPEPRRISLRALAAEIGTSHQLLSFYLQRLDKWQTKEYRRQANDIRARAQAENRSITPWEEAQIIAYQRASFQSMVDSVVSHTLRQFRKQIKHGKLSGRQVKMAKLLARKGCREAQKILNVHLQRTNNLPGPPIGPAKSFRMATGVAGNSAIVPSHALL